MRAIFMIIFFTFTIRFGLAQNKNPLDERYTPLKSSIFGSEKSSKKSNLNNDIFRSANMIKLSLTDFARSQVRLVYERSFSSSFSVTAGFGWSYGPDYIENLSTSGGLMTDLFKQNEPGEELSSLQHFSKYQSGYSISTTLKYIISEEYPSTSFVEFGYKYARQNYKSLIEISGVPVSDALFKANFNVLSVAYGNNWTYSSGRISFTHELSYGLGLKFYSWDQYLEIRDNRGYSVSFDKQANKTISNKYPIFILRYQMGIGW
ncbi:MAG: hypothetical protein WCP69_08180 [Bacteroidota bacterium]